MAHFYADCKSYKCKEVNLPRPTRTALMASALGLSLFVVSACGKTTTQAPDSVAEARFESPAVMPTVVPNEDPLPSGHPNSIQPETTLSISAEGKVLREPDIAIIRAGVQTEAETAEAALKQNATAMNGVFRVLERASIAKRDMQTSNFSLQPRYDYSNRQDGGQARLVGYTATNQLAVTVRDLDNLGATMDALVEAGGNTFSGLQFALDDDRAAKDEARRLAMQSAIARAELYAGAAGYEVARVVTISESGGYAPQPMAMMRSASADMAESSPIASGEVGYSVTVNVVFELRK